MTQQPTYSDRQLEIFAYTIYRTTHRWPTIEKFRETYRCSYKRAQQAIAEAQMTASGAIEATLFEALAIYAGFENLESALLELERWRKAPDLNKMKKSALRATVAMICPQHFKRRATVEELKQILRDAGVEDTPEKNLNKRRLQIQELYKDWPTIKDRLNYPSEYSQKWTEQEYANERSRRRIPKTWDWDNSPFWLLVGYQNELEILERQRPGGLGSADWPRSGEKWGWGMSEVEMWLRLGIEDYGLDPE